MLSYNRWFAYDTVTQLSFGEPLGFVKQGRDIENLIESLHNMAPFGAVVAALPWLARPFLESPVTRHFAMPKPGDGTGTGKIMAVGNFMTILIHDISADHRSSEITSSSNGSRIPLHTKAATSWITYWRPKMPTGPQLHLTR